MLPGCRYSRCVLVTGLVVFVHVLIFWHFDKALVVKHHPAVVQSRMLVELIVASPQPMEPEKLGNSTLQTSALPSPDSVMDLSTLAVADTPLEALRSAPEKLQDSIRLESSAGREAGRYSPNHKPSEKSFLASELPDLMIWPAELSGGGSNKKFREADRVVLRVLVDARGNVLDAILQRSSGFVQLDQLSLEYVQGRHLDLSGDGARPASQWVHVPVRFMWD